MNYDSINNDNIGNIGETDNIANNIDYNDTEITKKYSNDLFENIILPVIWGILFVYMISINILFIYYRNRPQFQYRGVKITLLYCISATCYVLLIIAAKIYEFSCIVKLWITDIFIVLSIFSVMSRAMRIIYLWKLNCYKLTDTKKKPITLRNNPYEPEANTYIKAVYKLINEEIAKRMIILPIIVDILITIGIHYLVRNKCDNNPLVFAPILVFVFIFTITFPFVMYQLHKVREYHRITSEVEYLINTIIWWIVFSLYGVTQFVPKFKNNEALQYYSNNGVFFFVIQELFVFIVVSSIPFYDMYSDKKKYKNLKEEEITMEYFYKLINDPIIIEELKEVAISEFSVENVLFWESYRELMKLTKRQKSNGIKKILHNGLNKINKELNNKASKSNIINKMVNHDLSPLINKDGSSVYEYSSNSNSYYDGLPYNNNNNNNNKKHNQMREMEMEMYPNKYNHYSNNESDFYCGSNNSSTHNLLQYSQSPDNYSFTFSPTSPINSNYTYIDNKYNSKNGSLDNYDKYDNYNYNLYQSHNQHQRRRSLKQFNINIETKSINTDINDNYSLSSSELSADTPVPTKYYNYYQNFYHIFIDINSTASVNINCSVRRAIEENIKNPKIGIFDEAKEEVILLMFRNLNSKLIIQLKQKQMI